MSETLSNIPLAERMRPKNLNEYLGQDQILGDKKPLKILIQNAKSLKRFPNIILWGPPGCGKTTLARLLAQEFALPYVSHSATSTGVKDAKELIEISKQRFAIDQTPTLLFLDEIHRFNKLQQDVFLPATESGTLILIGATTENPSFELNSALLSRSKVIVLKAHSFDSLIHLLKNSIEHDSYLKEEFAKRSVVEQNFILNKATEFIAQFSQGDARTALNLLEIFFTAAENTTISEELLENVVDKKWILYDKKGDEHYNHQSAFHKSLRASDVQGALYYLARMLESGEDPLVPARRMICMASEDIGLADPQAMVQATQAFLATERLGMPECQLVLAQACIYLATAPKSNAACVAINRARKEVAFSGPLPIPLHVRNAPTGMMKDLGYGKDYAYDHEYPNGVGPLETLPEKLLGKRFYTPSSRGFEKEIEKRLEYFRKIKSEFKNNS